MHIVVCIKQILDPEIPPRDFQIDPEAKEAARGKAGLVISPFDENALELGLQLKEKNAGAKLTVITVSTDEAVEALRKALALGADQVVLAKDEAFVGLDSYGTAHVLAKSIEKLGDASVVLLGRQAGDWDIGLVGSLVAEELALPSVTFVPEISVEGDTAQLKREVEGGIDVVEVALPVVATITNAESNQIRLPKVKDVMMAHRKPVTTWGAADLGVDAGRLAAENRAVLVEELFIPEIDSSCEFVEGEDGAEKAQNLVRKLQELKVL